MDRKTALSTAGALAMTSAAGVLALTMTIGQSAGSSPNPVPAPADVLTEYEIVQVNPDETITTTTVAPSARTVYEIEYVEEAAQSAMPAYDDDHEEHDDEEHEEDDDD